MRTIPDYSESVRLFSRDFAVAPDLLDGDVRERLLRMQ
jgi:hypothetical protein